MNLLEKSISDGKIYAFMQEGMLRVKVLHKLPANKVRLHSYNSAEHPDEIVDAHEIEIVGKVFWWSVTV